MTEQELQVFEEHRKEAIEHNRRLKEDPDYAYTYYKGKYDNMKPFNNSIPEPPIVSEKIYTEIIIPNFIRCGAIPKDKLIRGYRYIGQCRNAHCAIWDGMQFIYLRNKFGSDFYEYINDFEDYTEYDVFVPVKLADNYDATEELRRITYNIAVKKRQEYNNLILKKITNYLECNPDMRFCQVLYNLGFPSFYHNGDDSFYEESIDTYNRIKENEKDN